MTDFLNQCETNNWPYPGYSIIQQRMSSSKNNNHKEIELNIHLLPYYIENKRLDKELTK